MPEFDFSKKIKVTFAKKAIKVAKEIVPSPFYINGELEDKDIISNSARRIRVIQSFYKRNGYAQLSNQLLNYMQNFCTSPITLKLIFYISRNIKFTSNKIILNNNTIEIKNIVGERNLVHYTKILEEQNIVRRTNKQNVYVVNHEMIFKGNFSDFINSYIDIYKDVELKLDAKGRVILSDNINYKSE